MFSKMNAEIAQRRSDTQWLRNRNSPATLVPWRRSTSKVSAPAHQASSRTRSEFPDWIKPIWSFCHDRPERSHPFLVLLRPCRRRRQNQAGDRLGAFAPLAGLGLRLEARPDRDGRRGVGRRRRGLDQACRRNDAAGQHRGTRSHDRYRAVAVRRQGYCADQAFAVVPALGSLSVVVAAERGVPTAALGTVSLVGGRWRSLRGGEIDARIELDVRLRHSHQGGLALNASGDAIGMAVPGARRVLVIPSGDDRTCRRPARDPRPDRAGLSRGWPAARQARRWHRRDGDECRQGSGPSAAAGIRQGDVIVGWNDEKISGVRSLLRALGPDSVGSVVEVTVRRAGEPVRFKLTIGERPET